MQQLEISTPTDAEAVFSPFELDLALDGTIQSLVGEACQVESLRTLIGQPLEALAVEGSRLLLTEQCHRLIEGGPIPADSAVLICPNGGGSPRQALVSYRIRYGAAGDPIGFQCRLTPLLASDCLRSDPTVVQSLSHQFLQTSRDCIKVLDLEERLVLMNEAGTCAMEIDDFESIRGRTWSELWPAHSQQLVRDSFRVALTGNVARFQGSCPTVRGKPRWWDVIVSPILGISGVPLRVLAVSRDITEQHSRELEFHESESRFQTLANNMSQLAWMAEPAGDVFWYNQRWFDYTGTTLEQMKGWGWREVHHPDHLDRVVAKIKNSFERGEVWEDTFPLRGKDGKYRWFLSRMLPIRGATGQVVRWFGTNTDITDQLEIEQQLRRSEEKLLLGTAVGGLGLAEIDFVTDQVSLTSTAAEIYGFPPVAIVIPRSEFHQRYDARDRDRMRIGVASTIDQGEEYFADEHRICLDDGRVRWLSVRKQFFYEGPTSSRLKANRCLLACRDITAQRELEQNLEAARRQAEVASRAKSDFLANMSHEIRSPMTAILGYAELLESTDVEEQDKIEAIRRNGRFLLSLLNDILDLSKIEANKMELEAVAFGPGQVIEEVCSLMNVRAVERGLELSTDWASPLPAEILSDPIRLRQILVNLVGNALKFTEQGDVRVTTTYDTQAKQLRIAVSDTGRGISPELLSKLFRPFEQGDSSVARRFGGSGLGLSISHRLAKMLNGTIEVDSQVDVGSTFTLVLNNVNCTTEQLVTYPTGHQPPNDSISGIKPGFDLTERLNIRVLVVDDRRDIRLIVSQFVERAGGSSIVAEDGESALQIYGRETEAGRACDAILMDVQMPKIDGLTAVRKFRQNGVTVPIIALTANALEADRDACFAAGFTDYISKPVQHKRLIEMLHKYCAANRASAE